MSELTRQDPSGTDREREIFLEALDQPSLPERAQYLEKACGADVGLRAAVEALLAHHKSDHFLETPAMDPARVSAALRGPAGTELNAAGEKQGDRIGRYKLLQEIGEGACGTVFMAEQEEPVRRRVALKVVKAGMDTKSVIARFEAERQALALMDHPNIAKVFDAGTTKTGRPYFVMELVRGIRITEYCDQNQLSTSERLDLFIQVCHAIEHAHQKAVIHRDIKPSNILVTLHDGVPVPKVIDFGIAKAFEQKLTDKTVFTQFQAFIGTPAYTSPEQAEMSGLDIDTRSDIYSLGVLLYELLTGETPFDPKQLLESGLDEMRRIIREEEPLKPSTRVSTMGVDQKTALMRARHAPVPALVQAIRGDLDWIVMKCLEKDRTRRYPTASALAADIERYLNSEPVLARPPSATYRARKFIRRNRVVVTASVAVAVILLLAAIISGWLAFRATRAEREQARLRTTERLALKNEAEQRQLAEAEGLAARHRAYTSDMNLVQQALAANNYGRVIELLDRHRPGAQSIRRPSKSVRLSGDGKDFRQWEWRYFWNQSRSDASFALPQQSNSIQSILVSPNGRLLVTADRHGTVKLWDVGARQEVAVIRKQGMGWGGFGFGGGGFAFSPDGTRLALVSNRGPRGSAVKIWTVATREFTSEWPVEGGVDWVAFGQDGAKVFTFGRDAAIRSWQVDTGQLLSEREVEGMDRRGHSTAAFSPDAKWLGISQAGQIRVLNVETGETRSSFQAPDSDFWALAFSPDGEKLAMGASFSGTSTFIELFSTASGELLSELAGHVSWIPALAFTPDGRRLVSAGADQTIRIWETGAPPYREFTALRGHLSEIYAVAVTPDGKTILSGCKDGTLYGWDLQSATRKELFETLPEKIASVAFFPDGRGMLTVNLDRTASLWNPASLESEPIATLGTDVTRILLSRDGARVYAGTLQGDIKVLDWATRLVITNLSSGTRTGHGRPPGRGGPPGPQWPGPIGLVDQGKTLIVSGQNGLIRLIDTHSSQIKAEWKSNETPGFFGAPQWWVSPDEQSLVSATASAIEFRDLTTGKVEWSLPASNSGTSGIAFSPDGALLAASSADGTVSLWDLQKRELIDTMRGHLLGVHGVAFSPDGKRLATVSHGNEAVKLWDVATRHEVATLIGQGLFDSVKFSPDGRLIIAINMERTAYIWRAPSAEDIAAIEGQRVREAATR